MFNPLKLKKMRSNIFLFFIAGLALMLPTLSYAQVQEYRKFRLGFKAGVAIVAPTDADFGSGFKNSSATTGIAAIYGDYRFNDRWAIGPEVGFTVIRHSDLTLSSSDYKGTRPKLHVAPLVKFYVPKAKGLHITLGPELGITARKLCYGRGVILASPFPTGQEPPGWEATPVEGNKLKYNPISFAINAGIGYRFKKGVTFNAEYSAGLTRITHKNDYTGYDTAKDGMFRFTIGVDLYRRRK